MPPGEFATIAHIQTAIGQLLAAREPLFIQYGWRIFATIMVWRVFRLGMKWMYQRGDHSLEFVDLVLLLALNGALLTYYEQPLPGIGISASNVITDTTGFLAGVLDARGLQNTFTTLDLLGAKFVQPGVLDVLLNLYFWALSMGLFVVKGIGLGVMATAMIFTAVAGLVGPLFVPFLSSQKFDWIFWGWFKTFLEFAFLQVTMFAYLYVGGYYISQHVQALPDVIIDSQYPLYIGDSVAVIGAFAIGVVLVPVLNHALFSGSGGGSTGGGIFASMVRRG